MPELNFIVFWIPEQHVKPVRTVSAVKPKQNDKGSALGAMHFHFHKGSKGKHASNGKNHQKHGSGQY